MASRRARIAIAALFGIPLGLGLFTFVYAEGASYLGSDPAYCANCHIMWPQHDSWQKASHHGVATCVDCHMPASGVAKYVAKAVNGWNHSKAFTLQDFPEPMRMTPGNAAILQANCLRCHGGLVHEMVGGSTSDRDAVRCVHCHVTVGHGERAALGRDWRGEDAEGGAR